MMSLTVSCAFGRHVNYMQRLCVTYDRKSCRKLVKSALETCSCRYHLPAIYDEPFTAEVMDH